MRCTRREVGDLRLALHDVARLEVMTVLELEVSAALDDRVVEREAHAVLLEEQAAARPAVTGSLTAGPGHLAEGANDHVCLRIHIAARAAPCQG